MDNRGDKRPAGNDSFSMPPGTPKKARPSSPEKTGEGTSMCASETAAINIRNARRIMAKIKHRLNGYKNEDNPTKKLIEYVREDISKLDTGIKKKTTVGVFGKTGAGKSSLINAILGEKDLLPSGTLCACTSVIIQVGANVTDSNYTAEIEFISKEEWNAEVETLLNVLSEDGEERDNALFNTANEKITALYGEDGVFLTVEDLIKDENFTKIPEFLKSKIKKIVCEKASDLSDEIGCYIQHDESLPGECYWPVVKTVTIKVPNCKDFLEHVVLVDLPGTGDYNKSRDQMWRMKLRDCSTVWIVSEINRAAAEKDAWEIISSSITDMAQGGECSSLSFICTKTDDLNPQNYMRASKLKDDDFHITPEDPQYHNKKQIACIMHRNGKAKEKVMKQFLQQDTIRKHFDCDDKFLSVFTVSSEEFAKGDPILTQEQTEIPALKDLLRKYNINHINETTHHYISGALGILSLIQGSKESDAKMGITVKMGKKGEKRTAKIENLSKKRPSSCPERPGIVNVSKAKEIMTSVDQQLLDQLSNLGKFIEYIRKDISKLNTDKAKKTTVGVFGKTGAGKSSLINAILGEKDLLPSGTLSACTSVIIQVEANTTDSNYTAEIEFISKKAWKRELKTILNDLREDGEERDIEVINTAKEKITALYGEKGLSMTLENLMKDEHFYKNPEFLSERTKEIVCEKASDLSDEISCYIRHDDTHPVESYWPVVKCVTIKVPKRKDLLEHIVLVDLPGTGDCNKSRNKMWKSKLRDCSTMWIVSEINRAGSDSDAWKLLASSIKDLAQRGECRSISFICTKTDDIDTQDYMRSRKLTQDNLQITPEEICIMHRNEAAKEMVKKNFNQRRTLFKHFNCDDEFLSVYTVSSREFTKENPVLKPDQTEIPKLRDHLKKYNNSHRNKTECRYISGALGILSLIQGSKESNDEMMDEKSELYGNLEKELQKAFDPLVKYCQEISSSLEELLSKGAKDSEEKCYAIAKEIIEPGIDGRRFSRILSALCENDGCYTTKEEEMGDLNRSLAEPMEQQIDQTFTYFFTVQKTENSLLAKIDKFTFIPEDLISKKKKSPVLRHMLKFLQTQETNLKTELKEKIIKQKKEIYEIPYQCIKTTLQQGYRSAAECSGTGSMRRKQDVLLKLIETSKSTMFQKARREMLDELYKTLNFTKEMKTTLKKSMEYALLNANTLPNIDISAELEELKKL